MPPPLQDPDVHHGWYTTLDVPRHGGKKHAIEWDG